MKTQFHKIQHSMKNVLDKGKPIEADINNFKELY